MLTITFIRHGQKHKKTSFNDLEGSKLELTELGFKQAEITGQYLQSLPLTYRALYTSNFERCKQTAATINKYLRCEYIVDNRIRERVLNITDLDEISALLNINSAFDDWNWAPEGGDSINSVIKRFDFCIEDIKKKYYNPNFLNNIIVVTHTRALQSWVGHKTNDPDYFTYDVKFGNASLSVMEFDGTEDKFITLNSLSHLGEYKSESQKRID